VEEVNRIRRTAAQRLTPRRWLSRNNVMLRKVEDEEDVEVGEAKEEGMMIEEAEAEEVVGEEIAQNHRETRIDQIQWVRALINKSNLNRWQKHRRHLETNPQRLMVVRNSNLEEADEEETIDLLALQKKVAMVIRNHPPEEGEGVVKEEAVKEGVVVGRDAPIHLAKLLLLLILLLILRGRRLPL
jgi:hypothetical protein